MSISEIVIVLLALLSTHFIFETGMYLFKSFIEIGFGLDPSNNGIRAKLCLYIGYALFASAFITAIATKTQLPISIPTLAIVAIIILDFLTSCLKVRLWFGKFKTKE